MDDIVAVLDSLSIDAAVLIGHSFAGMELSEYGRAHATRCAGLVYLDAAYDYTDPELVRVFEQAPPPAAPPMMREDSASVQTMMA